MTDHLTMPLLDDLNRPVTDTLPRCACVRLYESLPTPEDKQSFSTALNSKMPASTLARRLSLVGLSLSPSSILRHRRGDCACGIKEKEVA